LLSYNNGRGMSEILRVVGNRHVIREHKQFKVYLLEYYNEIWEELSRQRKTVDVIIIVKD